MGMDTDTSLDWRTRARLGRREHGQADSTLANRSDGGQLVEYDGGEDGERDGSGDRLARKWRYRRLLIKCTCTWLNITEHN